MNKKFQIIGIAALLFIGLFASDALASAAEMWFSDCPLGARADAVTTVAAGDSLWIVVYDPGRNIDSTVRNTIPATDITVINPNTRLRLNPAWLGELKGVNGDPKRYFVETGPDTGVFVLPEAIIIGARAAAGTHIPARPVTEEEPMWVVSDNLKIEFPAHLPAHLLDIYKADPLVVFRLGDDTERTVPNPAVARNTDLGRFVDGDTLIGIYRSFLDHAVGASAMVQLKREEATIVWDREYYSDITGHALITIIDHDENLDPDVVEYVPIFIIVNPGSWNPVVIGLHYRFDFSLAVEPAAATVTQGEEVTATVTATLMAGITERVDLTPRRPLPTGITVTFAPDVGAPGFESTMTIRAAPYATVGVHAITIIGTGAGGVVKETTFTLTVEALPFDFRLAVAPFAATVVRPDDPQTTSATATVTATLVAGITEWVDLTFGPPLPTGITVTFYPTFGAPTFESTMTIEATFAAPLGVHEIIIIGKSYDGLVRRTTFTLTVVADHDLFDFSLAVAPTAATVFLCTEITAAVTATHLAGLTEQVYLTHRLLAGVAGITVTFTPAGYAPTFKSTMTIGAAPYATVGVHEITIIGTSYPGGLVKETTFFLTVAIPPPFDFGLTVAPRAATIIEGATTTADVTAILVAGVPENVTLTHEPLPDGITIAFTPPADEPGFTSTMTIGAAYGAPLGVHEITIIGTSEDGLVRRTTFSLTVLSQLPLGQVAAPRGQSATSFQMLLESGGVHIVPPLPYFWVCRGEPIRWDNIFDRDRYIIYVTDAGLAATDNKERLFGFDTIDPLGLTRVVFFAKETGADTGVFWLSFENLQAELGFNRLRPKYVLAAFYIDPNDFSDVAIATAYAGSAPAISPAVRFNIADPWLGRDRIDIEVSYSPLNRDHGARDVVVVQIFNPQSTDREWIILDEAGVNTDIFRSRIGLGLDPIVWEAGAFDYPWYKLGDPFDLGNKVLETFNRSASFVRLNAVEIESYPDEPEKITAWHNYRRVAFAEMKVRRTLVFDGAENVLNMRFVNAAGDPVIGYTIGEGVFIEVIDPDQNEDPGRRELIAPDEVRAIGRVIVFNSRTGLLVAVRVLWETDLDTGIFRSVEPISLIDHLGARTTGDTIHAFFQDPSDPSDAALITTRVVAVVNHPPIAVDDPDYTMLMDEVLTVDAPGVLANDTDLDDDPLRAELEDDGDIVAIGGELELRYDGSFTFTPPTGWDGTVTFTYRALDNRGGISDPATVTITVQKEVIAEYLVIEVFHVAHQLRPRFSFTGVGIAKTFSITIFNMLGREVWSDEGLNVGPGALLEWDGEHKDGHLLAKGPYIFVAVLTCAVDDDVVWTFRGTVFRKVN